MHFRPSAAKRLPYLSEDTAIYRFDISGEKGARAGRFV
jgi:hypothetical protein